jgi:hypothetical protein
MEKAISKDRFLFPFGVYSIKKCMMLHIGLYENEADVWKIWLGWGDADDIAHAKSQGERVIPLTLQYDPPKQ